MTPIVFAVHICYGFFSVIIRSHSRTVDWPVNSSTQPFRGHPLPGFRDSERSRSVLSRAPFRRRETEKERLAARFVALVSAVRSASARAGTRCAFSRLTLRQGRFLDGVQLQPRTEAGGAKPPPAAGGAGGGDRNRRDGTWTECSPCETLHVCTEA